MNSYSYSKNSIETKPFIYTNLFLIGVLIENFYPASFFPARPSIIVGVFLCLVSLPFIILALIELHKAKVIFDPKRARATLITTSIYKISRNPAYLSMVLFYIGLAFFFNSIWMIVIVPPAIYMIQKFCVEQEEKVLEARYGTYFTTYKTKVHRWI